MNDGGQNEHQSHTLPSLRTLHSEIPDVSDLTTMFSQGREYRGFPPFLLTKDQQLSKHICPICPIFSPLSYLMEEKVLGRRWLTPHIATRADPGISFSWAKIQRAPAHEGIKNVMQI